MGLHFDSTKAFQIAQFVASTGAKEELIHKVVYYANRTSISELGHHMIGGTWVNVEGTPIHTELAFLIQDAEAHSKFRALSPKEIFNSEHTHDLCAYDMGNLCCSLFLVVNNGIHYYPDTFTELKTTIGKEITIEDIFRGIGKLSEEEIKETVNEIMVYERERVYFDSLFRKEKDGPTS